ncbi:MAG: ThiF family adenylyltransferase [Pseudomonadota bacterium]
MIGALSLTLPGKVHAPLKAHLFPGDGREAAALLLCARAPGARERMLVREFIPVPHAACAVRSADAITWPGAYLEQAIDAAEAERLAIMPIHSHPGGLFEFSTRDDASDRIVMPALFQAHGEHHGSAIMTPDGAIRARLYAPNFAAQDVPLVSIVGDDIQFWWSADGPRQRRPMAFTGAMARELGRLCAVVIGVSGTGSLVAEQLARLGFGRVILIDFDRVEGKNLNRIVNTRIVDVTAHRLKVESFAEAVEGYRGVGVAVAVPKSVTTREAIEVAASGDVLFSCVDTLEARQIADLMASAFLLPLLDVGVVIPVRKDGDGHAIGDVCGRIDYVQPGGSTLQDRGVYTPADIRAEYLRRAAPEAHQLEVEAGYIRGLMEEAPGVITLNMRAAAASVNEFIARAYPYRFDPNDRYARTMFSLAACEEDYTAEDAFPVAPNTLLASGDTEPLLGLAALKRPRKVAA